MSLAFLALLPQLVAAGISTAEEIRSIIKSLNAGLTDAELNTILQAIQTSAARHQAQANTDAGH